MANIQGETIGKLVAQIDADLSPLRQKLIQLDAEIQKARGFERLRKNTERDLTLMELQLRRTGGIAQAWGKQLSSLGQNMSNIGQKMTMGLTLPVVALGAVSMKSAMEFEQGFAHVSKTVDGVIDDFGKLNKDGEILRQGMRDLAKTIPVPVSELNKIGEALGQIGIAKENIVSFTATIAKLGVTTDLAGEEAAISVARFSNVMGLASNDFERIASTMVRLGQKGASSVGEIMNISLRMAGAANLAGLKAPKVLSYANALASLGVNLEIAGSGFSRLIKYMMNATQLGGEKLQTFAKTANMTAKQFVDAFKTDPAIAINAFLAGLKRMKEQGGPVLQTMAALQLNDIRISDVVLKAAQGIDTITASLNEGLPAWQENTALAKTAAVIYDTTTSKVQIMKNKLNDVAITLGTVFTDALVTAQPTIEAVVRSIESAVKMFAALPPGVQETILKFTLLGVALGPLMVGLGAVTQGIGGLLRLFGMIATAGGNAASWLGGLGKAAQTTANASQGAATGIGALGAKVSPLPGILTVAGLAAYGLNEALSATGDYAERDAALIGELSRRMAEAGEAATKLSKDLAEIKGADRFSAQFERIKATLKDVNENTVPQTLSTIGRLQQLMREVNLAPNLKAEDKERLLRDIRVLAEQYIGSLEEMALEGKLTADEGARIMGESFRKWTGGFDSIARSWDESVNMFQDKNEDISDSLRSQFNEVVRLFGFIEKKTAGTFTRVNEITVSKMKATSASVIMYTNSIVESFRHMFDAVVGHSYVPDMVKGVVSWFNIMERSIVRSTKDSTESAKADFRQLRDEVAGIFREFENDSGMTDLRAMFGINEKTETDLDRAIQKLEAARRAMDSMLKKSLEFGHLTGGGMVARPGFDKEFKGVMMALPMAMRNYETALTNVKNAQTEFTENQKIATAVTQGFINTALMLAGFPIFTQKQVANINLMNEQLAALDQTMNSVVTQMIRSEAEREAGAINKAEELVRNYQAMKQAQIENIVLAKTWGNTFPDVASKANENINKLIGDMQKVKDAYMQLISPAVFAGAMIPAFAGTPMVGGILLSMFGITGGEPDKEVDKKISDRLRGLIELTNEFARDMQNNFSNLFFDLMEGKLDSFQSFWKSILQNIKRMIADFLSSALMKQLMGVLTNALGITIGGGGETKAIPSHGSGGVVSGPYRGAPVLRMLHAGETVLPTHKSGFSFGAPTVNIEVVNKSGMPVGMKQIGASMKDHVYSIIVELFSTNGDFRNMVRGT